MAKGVDKKTDDMAIMTAKNLRFAFGHSVVFGPYELRQPRGSSEKFIVDTKEDRKAVALDLYKEPNLFVRFAELSETDEAYLDFVSDFGFLGLRNHQDFDIYWREDEEPTLLINSFHRKFRDYFKMASDHVITKRVAPMDSRKEIEELTQIDSHLGEVMTVLEKHFPGSYAFSLAAGEAVTAYLDWFNRYLKWHTSVRFIDLEKRPVIYAETLIGTLILQLHRFLVVGKHIKECDFPGCNRLITTPRWCTDNHRKEFWRGIKNKNIYLKDGSWFREPPRKRGRPRKKKE